MQNSSFLLSLIFNERDKNTWPRKANLKEELSLLLFQVKLLYLFNFYRYPLTLLSKWGRPASRCNHFAFCNTKDKITKMLAFTFIKRRQMIFRSDGPWNTLSLSCPFISEILCHFCLLNGDKESKREIKCLSAWREARQFYTPLKTPYFCCLKVFKTERLA